MEFHQHNIEREKKERQGFVYGSLVNLYSVNVRSKDCVCRSDNYWETCTIMVMRWYGFTTNLDCRTKSVKYNAKCVREIRYG